MTVPVPTYMQAAAIVRAQVTDGTLRPGQAAPSGARLARLTGYCQLAYRAEAVTPADDPLPPTPALTHLILHWSDGTAATAYPSDFPVMTGNGRTPPPSPA